MTSDVIGIGHPVVLGQPAKSIPPVWSRIILHDINCVRINDSVCILVVKSESRN
ncbi:MAG: hypothetical protein P8Q96_03105 [Candidatus Thalassarchaeaceae archaeon]|nr:hypothetical protein [Candidatus Thalassarchaeaceae archaeon]